MASDNTRKLAETVIVAPTDPIYRALRRAGSCSGKDGRIDLFRYSLLPESAHGVAIVGPALGAPAAALLVERLAREAVTRIVLFSVCGSLMSDLRVGDLFIPTGGLSEEGTSKLYSAGEIPAPDRKLSNRLVGESRRIGLKPREGLIWTTDAPYRETTEKIDRFRKAGAMAVDMEFTAMATVCRFHKILFSALMVVSDERTGGEPTIGFGSLTYREGLRQGMEALFHVTG